MSDSSVESDDVQPCVFELLPALSPRTSSLLQGLQDDITRPIHSIREKTQLQISCVASAVDICEQFQPIILRTSLQQLVAMASGRQLQTNDVPNAEQALLSQRMLFVWFRGLTVCMTNVELLGQVAGVYESGWNGERCITGTFHHRMV